MRECFCSDDCSKSVTLLEPTKYPIDNGASYTTFKLVQCLSCGGLRAYPSQNMRMFLLTNDEEHTRELLKFCDTIQNGAVKEDDYTCIALFNKFRRYLKNKISRRRETVGTN